MPRTPASRPNLVSVGTIVWLSSELMFFAALFAMYFTIKSVDTGWASPGRAHPGLPARDHQHDRAHPVQRDLPDGRVRRRARPDRAQGSIFDVGRWGLREWYVLSFLMGLYFVLGQGYEYLDLIFKQHLTLSSSNYGSVFFLTTGFHGLHVSGGLVAFLFLLGRTYAAKRFTHEQQTSAIVVSYYWHFVDVVWIGLFTTIYLLLPLTGKEDSSETDHRPATAPSRWLRRRPARARSSA